MMGPAFFASRSFFVLFVSLGLSALLLLPFLFVDFLEQKIVQCFFAGADVAKALEDRLVVSMLKKVNTDKAHFSVAKVYFLTIFDSFDTFLHFII